mgnify:CR=1 FL=1
MVQQVQAPPADPEDSPDLVIEDSTQPEALAAEAEVLAGRTPQPQEAAQLTDTPAPVVEPATTPEPVAAAPATPTPAAPRTYTAEEVRRIQAADRGRIEAARKQAEDAQRRLGEMNLDAQVEAYLRQEEQKLAPTMGEDEARAFTRSPDRTKQVRDHYNAQQQLREIEAQRTNDNFEREVGAMVQTALMFQTKYNVAQDDMEVLMATTTPAAMEKAARRLSRASAEKAKAAADLKAQVPPESKSTSLETGVSGTSAPESEDTRIERLNMTPSWEWTPGDVKFMRGM